MIRLKNNDGVLGQSGLVDFLQQCSNPIIVVGEKGCVKIAGIGKVLVVLQPLWGALIGVVRRVEGEVDQEGIFLML